MTTLNSAPLDQALGGRRSQMPDCIRLLAVDAVQQADSDHPGAPMGMAGMGTAMWTRHLRHNPANPGWPDRDRFVLRIGHALMRLSALLHLTGCDLPMGGLRRFRQLGSKAPGHPEVHGAPLGAAGVAALCAHLGWTAPPFGMPADLRAAWACRAAGAARQADRNALFARCAAAHPALAAEFIPRQRSAVRTAALVQQRVVHVFTHDAIGLGDDGPTHQPVEQVASPRLVPGLEVWRPADALETAVARVPAPQRHAGPSALEQSRQALPTVARPARRADVAQGGDVLADAPVLQPLRAVVVATGSAVIGIASAGTSAPGPVPMQHVGVTAGAVVVAVRRRVAPVAQA